MHKFTLGRRRPVHKVFAASMTVLAASLLFFHGTTNTGSVDALSTSQTQGQHNLGLQNSDSPIVRSALATFDEDVGVLENEMYSSAKSTSSRSKSGFLQPQLDRSKGTSLDMLCDSENGDGPKQFDKNEFEMHVGRALDTLRKDYPKILTEDPDYSIYDTKLEVIDPSGVKVHGLKAYQNSFRLLHAVVKILYCPAKSSISVRMCYDKARNNIRIHWNAEVVPREIFGGSRVTNYVDGISVYELDRQSGNITEHRIERLLMNDAPVRPKEGIIAALRQQHTVSVPSFIQTDETGYSNSIAPFQQQNPLHNVFQYISTGHTSSSSLFALEATSDDTSNFDDSLKAQFPNLDWAAFESKNKSRKKFGLKALSPEEFLELEAQVQQIAMQQQEKVASARQSAAAERAERKKDGFLSKLFGTLLENTCESNYDCERPQVCCDYGFKKQCCMSGSPVGRFNNNDGFGQMQPIRVPAGYPPGQGPVDDPRNY